eukprot:TRINITY_DN5181_c2_g1_i1.p1 TRINITY_DN5181_c2_g1~~TRINITY_DN5181_c2_g1_i1.p1  ORF type:complete len:410 (+),score=102.03 TRINITY_DN5181_c2_g1_i1:51-1232(+)
MGDRTEVLFKILVVGDVGAGKSSFVKRYAKEKWVHNCKPTIGVDFVLKEVTLDCGALVRVQLWDIAGQERFRSATRIYYKEAVGAVVMFDCTNQESLNGVDEWKADLDNKVTMPDGSLMPCLLLGNKSDLPEDTHILDKSDLDRKASKDNFFKGEFCSAKSGEGIEGNMKEFIEHIFQVTQRAPAPKKVVEEKAPIALTPSSSGKPARNYKIIVMGSKGSGKSSLIKKFVHDTFSSVMKSTTSLAVETTDLELRDLSKIKVQLWDLPTHPKAEKLNTLYHKDAVGAIMVYDASDPSSLKKVKLMKQSLNAKQPNLPTILIANKIDLPQAQLLDAKPADDLCSQYSFISIIDTSVVGNQNVSEPFHTICNHISKTNPKAGIVTTEPVKKKSSCC